MFGTSPAFRLARTHDEYRPRAPSDARAIGDRLECSRLLLINGGRARIRAARDSRSPPATTELRRNRPSRRNKPSRRNRPTAARRSRQQPAPQPSSPSDHESRKHRPLNTLLIPCSRPTPGSKLTISRSISSQYKIARQPLALRAAKASRNRETRAQRCRNLRRPARIGKVDDAPIRALRRLFGANGFSPSSHLPNELVERL